jgi:hypothetical protein
MGRLVLFVMQLVIGWGAGLALVKATPFQGPLRLALLAVAFAALAWVVGLVAAELLQGVPRPTPATLAAALIGGGLGLAILLLPPYVPQLKALLARVPDLYLPLVGAVIGYHLRLKS